ncbi:MAG: 3-phosphoshikimate 1-carboxyvinyltransferase, partial [Clostridia bacterium]|nr:3-phosphoshikimate 1-carboxyvinyltransferase [Clostridia bacterium]
MNVTLTPVSPCGTLPSIASKSAAHRLLICAAFADTPTKIRCEQINEDIEATVDCLSALGATVIRNAPFYLVTPIQSLPQKAILPCKESGSTLRFFVPIVAALGISASFEMAGRLPLRPLSPLREELEAKGISFSPVGSNPLVMEGRLRGNDFTVPGNVSSQFISGMLFALCLCRNGGKLCVTGKAESLPYIDLTRDALTAFGGRILCDETEAGRIYTVLPREGKTPDHVQVEGDWSNAA